MGSGGAEAYMIVSLPLFRGFPCKTPRRHSDRSPGPQGRGVAEESRLGLTHEKPLVLR